MAEAQQAEPGAGERAQRAADALALALEESGFDVGRAFPALRGGLDRTGAPIVDVGGVAASVAGRLAGVLAAAAQHGITVPEE